MLTTPMSRWSLGTLVGLFACASVLCGSPCSVVTTSSGSAVTLTEAPEGGSELYTCTLPPGVAAPLVETAVALTENPNSVPLIISDVIVFAPTGLITFYSDPNLPPDVTINETQTEAAHNFVTLNGTNYILTSDVTPEPPEVPEPKPAFLLLAAAGMFGIVRVFAMRRSSA